MNCFWLPVPIAFLAAFPAAQVAAQDGTWVVVAASIQGEDARAAHDAVDAAAEHLRGRGWTVLSGRSLTTRLAERVSSAFVPANAEQVERFTNAVDPTLNLVVDRHYEQARAVLDPLLSEAGESMSALGRDELTARSLANLCLFRVRVELEARRTDEARRAAVTCVRLLPDVNPETLLYGSGSQPMHPPAVRNLVAGLRDDLGEDGGRLIIEAPDAEGRSCAVRVQGRVLARAVPAELTLPRGAYQVQVECGTTPGRVHVARVAAEPVTVAVNTSLDDVLGASPSLELSYPTVEDRRRQLRRDLALLASRIEATDVLAVTTETASSLRVEHVEAPPGGSGGRGVSLSLGAGDQIPGAVDALLSGTSTAAGDAVARAPEEEADGPSLVGPLVVWVAGAALVGIAVYALAATGNCTEMDGTRCSERDRAASPEVWLFGGAGLLTIGAGVAWYVLAQPAITPADATAWGLGVRGVF